MSANASNGHSLPKRTPPPGLFLGLITCGHDNEIFGAPCVRSERFVNSHEHSSRIHSRTYLVEDRLIGSNAVKCRELPQPQLAVAIVIVSDRSPLQLLAGQSGRRKEGNGVAKKAVRVP